MRKKIIYEHYSVDVMQNTMSPYYHNGFSGGNCERCRLDRLKIPRYYDKYEVRWGHGTERELSSRSRGEQSFQCDASRSLRVILTCSDDNSFAGTKKH